MCRDDFSKEAAAEARTKFHIIFEALDPKAAQQFSGHRHSILMFLTVAADAAPAVKSILTR